MSVIAEEMSPSGAPADLAANLAQAPTCSGWLLKYAGPPSTEQWKKWHFELRGAYLCYFQDEAIARGVGANSPQGVIDLRQILTPITLTNSNDELMLTSKTGRFRFRADSDSLLSSSTLAEWALSITRVQSDAASPNAATTSDADTPPPRYFWKWF